MKKRKIFGWAVLLCILLYFPVGWKLPFYVALLCIDLPEDAIVLERKVSLTDECHWHIVAETAFASNLDYDEIRETVWTENRLMIEKINHMDRVKMGTMDAAMVSESCCGSYISEKKMDKLMLLYPEYHHWYSVTINVFGDFLRRFAVWNPVIVFVLLAVIGIIFARRGKEE
ncbi:MAG: hypothetical protein ACI4DW_07150 [Lachnospiraceae bacterium]